MSDDRIALMTTRPDGSAVPVEVFSQERYRCPACRKSWSKKTTAKAHVEGGCWRDPANKSCRTCEHHLVELGEPEVGIPASESCLVSDNFDWPDYPVGCADWGPNAQSRQDETPEDGR